MKHVILGTAGHVDHGKTMLIKALTGIDTDRLSEEKKRGITIELGFAHLDFEDGLQVGIVDVPGHEKFIKNMLAGAGGMDLAMLVVAADEGFMPQTVEHLGILSLLGVRDGLVVLTKCDLVDEDWLDLIREDVAARVRGTFLEGKPVLAVSACTGEGIPTLRETLHQLVLQAEDRNLRAPFRLPIDRVFTIEGFGTVVTGTMTEGALSVGDTVAVRPGTLEARVRNLQVHGQDVQTVYAGQRAALNLAGVKKSDLTRGSTLAKPGSLRTTRMVDVRLEHLRSSERVILSGSQVHLYHGASVRLAKVILLDRDALKPGEHGYAQLRMTEELDVKPRDHFVIRFFSPLETIGGGIILDEAPARHRRGDPAVLEGLAIRESGSRRQQLLHVLTGQEMALPDAAGLAAMLNLPPEETESTLEELCAAGEAVELLPGRYASGRELDRLWERCRSILEQYHRQNPLHGGMKTAELRQKLLPATDQSIADAVLQALCAEGKLRAAAERCALADFRVQLTKKQRLIREQVLRIYHEGGLETPGLDEVRAGFSQKEQNDCRQVLEYLTSGGGLVLLTPQICLERPLYEEICRRTAAYFEDHGELTLAQYRDLLQTSRKYALALLEHFDKLKILKKCGDYRVIYHGFQNNFI